MKVSEQWLRTWANPPVDTDTLVEQLTAAGLTVDTAEPLASVDYVSLADPDSFEELEQARGSSLLSLAVRIGQTRLIDNIRLDDGRQD